MTGGRNMGGGGIRYRQQLFPRGAQAIEYSFRPYISLNLPQHHHMVAQQGSGSEPVHTLYDEQGNEALAELTCMRQLRGVPARVPLASTAARLRPAA